MFRDSKNNNAQTKLLKLATYLLIFCAFSTIILTAMEPASREKNKDPEETQELQDPSNETSSSSSSRPTKKPRREQIAAATLLDLQRQQEQAHDTPSSSSSNSTRSVLTEKQKVLINQIFNHALFAQNSELLEELLATDPELFGMVIITNSWRLTPIEYVLMADGLSDAMRAKFLRAMMNAALKTYPQSFGFRVGNPQAFSLFLEFADNDTLALFINLSSDNGLKHLVKFTYNHPAFIKLFEANPVRIGRIINIINTEADAQVISIPAPLLQPAPLNLGTSGQTLTLPSIDELLSTIIMFSQAKGI